MFGQSFGSEKTLAGWRSVGNERMNPGVPFNETARAAEHQQVELPNLRMSSAQLVLGAMSKRLGRGERGIRIQTTAHVCRSNMACRVCYILWRKLQAILVIMQNMRVALFVMP